MQAPMSVAPNGISSGHSELYIKFLAYRPTPKAASSRSQGSGGTFRLLAQGNRSGAVILLPSRGAGRQCWRISFCLLAPPTCARSSIRVRQGHFPEVEADPGQHRHRRHIHPHGPRDRSATPAVAQLHGDRLDGPCRDGIGSVGAMPRAANTLAMRSRCAQSGTGSNETLSLTQPPPVWNGMIPEPDVSKNPGFSRAAPVSLMHDIVRSHG